jgi:hypothetical protein
MIYIVKYTDDRRELNIKTGGISVVESDCGFVCIGH